MLQERRQIPGDVVISEPMELWGTVGGNVTVVRGGKLYLRGTICGSLLVEYGGRVHIYGNVVGDLTIRRGGKVIHSGVLGGSAHNRGGRLFVEAKATIEGSVKTRKDADTVFERTPGAGY